MAGFINKLRQQQNNSIQCQEFKRAFTKDCKKKCSDAIVNCNYPFRFTGQLLMNFKPTPNPKILHQIWEISDNMATSEEQSEHKNENDNENDNEIGGVFNMMCASDRILYDEGYQKSPCQTTYDIILILQDNGEYEAEHFDKIMNGWLRFIGDVTCEDAVIDMVFVWCLLGSDVQLASSTSKRKKK
eukprot:51259_1